MSKQIVRTAEWLPGRKCMSLYLLSFYLSLTHVWRVCFDCTRADGDFCLGVAHARDVVVLPTWGLLWNPRAPSSFMGRLIRQAPWGTPRGCFSVIKLSLYSWKVRIFLARPTLSDRWHKTTLYAYLSQVLFCLTQVQICQAFRLLLLSSSLTSEIILLSHRPPAFIRFVYFWVMGKLYVT